MVAERPVTVSPVSEPCLRCGAEMEWRHETWQCPRCRFKLGCCEGEPQSCAAEPLRPARGAELEVADAPRSRG